MRAARPEVSARRACRVLGVARSALRVTPRRTARVSEREANLEQRLADLIQRYPTFGYRRLWAMLRRDGVGGNRKAVYRFLKRKGWLIHQRAATPRPRAQGRTSRAEASDERWAMDVTHIDCGKDGWAHLAVVIDCHDREVIGYEFSLRGRAQEAERALGQACLGRVGTLRLEGPTPVVRSDNGLIFQSRRFRAACRAYGLTQEFITPYTPEQNGLIERFFRSLKEECVWVPPFRDFVQARQAVAAWIGWYNTGRPHQALGYCPPTEFRTRRHPAAA